ncbi:MAG: hypothetical protein CMK59_00105, partial [Proteobacteria bacterium]|nr:hypothetical protein [Pseudomonadota bacterium]
SKVYVNNVNDGNCYDEYAYCDSGDVAVSGGCSGGNGDWAFMTQSHPTTSNGVPNGWHCRWSSWQGCYSNGSAYVICMDLQ